MPSSLRFGLILAAVAALVVVALGSWRAERDGDEVLPPPAPEAHVGAEAEGGESPPPSTPAPLPTALRGLEPSGGLRVDSSGAFVPDAEAILFIEHFLAASNEASLDALREHIRRAIEERLDSPARESALAFLDEYLAYRRLAAEELSDPELAASADLERRFQWIRELRRRVFGAERAEALFAAEEEAVRVRLEVERVREDPSLDPEERRLRLAELEARYPAPMREARARAVASLDWAQEEQDMRAEGFSAAEIHAAREARFGVEAAERMAALDAARAQWATRLDRYQQERDALIPTLDGEEETRRALEELRAVHFSPEEARRVEILERAPTR